MRKNQLVGLGFAAAMLAYLSILSAAPAASVAGDWEGSTETARGDLKVVLHIAAGKDGTFTGTLDSPDQGATGIPFNLITYKEPELHFEIERLACSYDGKISGDGSQISGLFKQGGGSAPLAFNRVSKPGQSINRARALEQWAESVCVRKNFRSRSIHVPARCSGSSTAGVRVRDALTSIEGRPAREFDLKSSASSTRAAVGAADGRARRQESKHRHAFLPRR